MLFLENHDSFTWNLVDSLPFDRQDILVRSGRQAASDPAALEGVDALVIGPGPTDPWRAGLLDVVLRAAARRLPSLGICLGHQALGLAFGARLQRTRPVHGEQHEVVFSPSRFFRHLRGAHTVMRYHSLVLAEVSPPLHVVASTDDGLAMAVEHESLPMAGLQFHPDSYGTPRGREMLASFFEAAA